MKKPFYLSKTFWVNVLSILAMILVSAFGIDISPEVLVYALAGINVILRFMTKEPIGWRVDLEADKDLFRGPSGSDKANKKTG